MYMSQNILVQPILKMILIEKHTLSLITQWPKEHREEDINDEPLSLNYFSHKTVFHYRIVRSPFFFIDYTKVYVTRRNKKVHQFASISFSVQFLWVITVFTVYTIFQKLINGF